MDARSIRTLCFAALTVFAACSPPSPSSPGDGGAASLTVGVLVPLTGTLASVGKDHQDGFSLYLAEHGDTVAGRRIVPVYVDTQGQADVGLTKAKLLVERERAEVLMGIVATPVCYAVAAYARDAGVPMLASAGCAAQRLTTDARFASPQLARLSISSSVLGDPAGDWAFRSGHRRAILIASDYGGGLEVADAFASTFVKRGGSIVQELYPALGTADFGPFVAQLDRTADVIVSYVAGLDGLRFAEQYLATAGSSRRALIDGIGGMTDGPNLAQLGLRGVGLVGVNLHTEAVDTAASRAFVAAFRARYPGRPLSGNVALGHSAAQALAAAVRAVDGRVDDRPRFMRAVAAIDIQSARGRLRLDDARDAVQDMYVFEVVDRGGAAGPRLVETYPGISRTWDRTHEELGRFPFGQMRGRWVGMTRAMLQQVIAR